MSNWSRNEKYISLQVKTPKNLKSSLLILDKKYKDCLKGYKIEKEDDNYIYIDISLINKEINLKLI